MPLPMIVPTTTAPAWESLEIAGKFAAGTLLFAGSAACGVRFGSGFGNVTAAKLLAVSDHEGHARPDRNPPGKSHV